MRCLQQIIEYVYQHRLGMCAASHIPRRFSLEGIKLKKHGLSNTKLYSIWSGMKRRCYNKNERAYKHYGGRGITICDEWKNDFMSFYDWAMNNGYSEGLTIDRIDNNKGYSPENCRWATVKEQNRNYRRNIKVEYKGETKTLVELAEEYNIDYKLLHQRYKRYNWDIEKALSLPSNCEKLEIDGQIHSKKEWAEINGISPRLVYDRIYNGWDKLDAIQTPIAKRFITSGGESHTVSEWAAITGVNASTINFRLRNGWREEDAVRPARKQKELTLGNETHSISEWSKITGIKECTIYNRLKIGWSVEKTLTSPLWTK